MAHGQSRGRKRGRGGDVDDEDLDFQEAIRLSQLEAQQPMTEEERRKREEEELEQAIQLSLRTSSGDKPSSSNSNQEYQEALKKLQQENESLSAEVAKFREEQIEQNENRKKGRDLLLAKCSEELKCSICDEIFISPQTLNCDHVYCKYCIDQWKLKSTGGFTCPNCRSKITSQSRSLHLENLIESLYKDVDQSVKEEREMLLNERKALILADQAPVQAPATPSQQTANENAAANSGMIGAIINRQRQANPSSGPQGIITANNPRPNAPGNQRPGRSNAPVLRRRGPE